jgi:sarcosine oxidase
LQLTRQPLLWFQPKDASLVRPDRLPVFFLQSDVALTYGLPDIAGSGVKAGSHYSGGALSSADAVRHEVTAAEASALTEILQTLVPAAAGAVTRTSLCVYSRSPDEHFILGPHVEAPQIVMASPCSGHGFKFASIIGEILVDLALDHATAWPIGLFNPQRF